jgi:hypothetical protein
MSKKFIYIILTILLFLLTFFGLGPVLFADGTNTERLYTLLIVVALYLIIFVIFYFVHKRMRK